jgi:glycosyltransferase involved in cell wall biosynthesis
MRRHKYFPIGTRVCDRPAGIDCYLHLCFIQKAAAGSRIPIRLTGVGERRHAIRAHRKVRRFLVGSEWMRRELVMNGVQAERVEIVPPIPAALADIQSAPPSERREILFVGQLIRGKGVDLLLRGLAEVPPPWHATVVGTGNHLETCRSLAGDLGIADRVHFAGWVPHGELTRFYVDAALTVVPSRWPEPFGMVGIEAMARGRPVVGFAVGGIPDWLEDEVTGLLVPEADTVAMAAAIGRLLGDPALRLRLGEAAVQRVRERYQPSGYLTRLMHILETTA